MILLISFGIWTTVLAARTYISKGLWNIAQWFQCSTIFYFCCIRNLVVVAQHWPETSVYPFSKYTRHSQKQLLWQRSGHGRIVRIDKDNRAWSSAKCFSTPSAVYLVIPGCSLLPWTSSKHNGLLSHALPLAALGTFTKHHKAIDEEKSTWQPFAKPRRFRRQRYLKKKC